MKKQLLTIALALLLLTSCSPKVHQAPKQTCESLQLENTKLRDALFFSNQKVLELERKLKGGRE